MLKPLSWPLPMSLLSPPTASVPPLTQPCHPLCTELIICPAPSCSLWKPICAVKLPTYIDHILLSGSHSLLVFYQFKSVDFRDVASPLAAFSKSQNHCICPGCSRIKSSWGTRGSCCLLSKTKHPLHLQLCISNISRLNWRFFPGKEHPCKCPALKLFCLCKAGKRRLSKPFPVNAGNFWWGLGKASTGGCFCTLPNRQPLPREACSMHTAQHVLKRLSLLPSNFQECARGEMVFIFLEPEECVSNNFVFINVLLILDFGAVHKHQSHSVTSGNLCYWLKYWDMSVAEFRSFAVVPVPSQIVLPSFPVKPSHHWWMERYFREGNTFWRATDPLYSAQSLSWDLVDT